MSQHDFISELKFVLSDETASHVQEWSRVELEADPHAPAGTDRYRTASLYFDTEDFDMFFRRRSYARAKFRIRNYNGGSHIFLERKMKASNRVLKRRSEATLDDLARLTDYDAQWSGRWFARRLQNRRLQPVCQITYLRTARMGMSLSGALRLTMDEHIRAAAIDTTIFTASQGVEVLPGKHILELKYYGHVPLLFKRLIEKFKLAPQPISKYRLSGHVLDFTGIRESAACLSF